MSWFAEFAGKAEDMLNKLDQNAAAALNQYVNRKTISDREKREVSICVKL